VFEQTAKSFVANDWGVLVFGGGSGNEKLVAAPLVVPFVMIVIDESENGATEMRKTQRRDVIEAFGFDGEHESLGECVEVGTAGGQAGAVSRNGGGVYCGTPW
jgi:hypothetical protein